MEAPVKLPPGQYLVTGDREITTRLTVSVDAETSETRWELDQGTLFDVTHLPCRAARYTAATSGSGAEDEKPASTFPIEKVGAKDYPVKPGASMPPVDGCSKQDYAVLFVIGLPVQE
jgi:hypothetical protein